MKIKDSGQRTEFESGAVRDMQGDDKGRCDLMPLDVVSRLMYEEDRFNEGVKILCMSPEMRDKDPVLWMIHRYQTEGDTKFLAHALAWFCAMAFPEAYETAMLELSVHFRDGAKKYGENNWQKGLPEWSYISSAIRHYLKWRRGDDDERHDRAFMWNIVCLIWTVENGVNEQNVMAEVVAETKEAFGRCDEDWSEGE